MTGTVVMLARVVRAISKLEARLQKQQVRTAEFRDELAALCCEREAAESHLGSEVWNPEARDADGVAHRAMEAKSVASPPITDADASADLAGKPRPDHPTVHPLEGLVAPADRATFDPDEEATPPHAPPARKAKK